MKVVVTGRIPDAGLEVLASSGADVIAWDGLQPQSREQLLVQVKGAVVLVTLLTERIDDEVLDAAGPQLKGVCNVAVGYNNIDVAACTARGIAVTNTPDVLTDATADTTMALLLMVTRNFVRGDRLIRAGEPWAWGMFFMLGMGLRGRRLGLVGFGAIGKATARRAKAFGMEIAYYDVAEAPQAVVEELGATRLSLDEILASSDVVSIHTPYLPATHHLIDADALAKMQEHAYLINSARGPIIDEAALVDALRDGVIAGAGLDVYEFEPKVSEGLLGLDNVVLLPHLGSATVETRDAMVELAAANAVAILRGETPPTPVPA